MSLTAHRENNVFHVTFVGELVERAFGLPILDDPTTASGGVYADKIIKTETGLDILMEPTTRGAVVEYLTAHRTGPNTFRVVGAIST